MTIDEWFISPGTDNSLPVLMLMVFSYSVAGATWRWETSWKISFYLTKFKKHFRHGSEVYRRKKMMTMRKHVTNNQIKSFCNIYIYIYIDKMDKEDPSKGSKGV